MSRWRSMVCWGGIALALGAAAVYPCALDYSFRAYLDRRFWQPLSKYEESLGRTRQTPSKATGAPFAGMSAMASNEAVRRAGLAYRTGTLAEMRTAVQAALQSSLSPREREEILLLDAKIDLQQADQWRKGPAEQPKLRPDESTALRRVTEKLRAYIQTAKDPTFKGEARGWLARAHYLLGEYAPAAKIYLDELSRPDTVFSRESLIASLRIIFPYNGTEARLADHLEDYFDTPAHALFVVNLVTNPIYDSDGERAAMAAVAQKTINVLQKRRDLFRSGPDSHALALTLMRAALYMGDTQAALAYARQIPTNSEAARRPEYNWMVGGCHFLQQEYAAAEAPLLRMYRSPHADERDRMAAAQGLLGVYQKLGRDVDQLHAAFLYYRARQGRAGGLLAQEGDRDLPDPYLGFTYWRAGGWLVDLSYLLDVQLTDDDLRQYLQRYARSAERIVLEFWTRQGTRRRSAREVVEYALAVRYAREERYAEAATLYERLFARPRAKRMRALARLHAEATNFQGSSEQLLEAQFTYAAFLEAHSTRVFFNDMVWQGFQDWMFLGNAEGGQRGNSFPPDAKFQGLTREVRESFLVQERKVRDEQEERWRAYGILAAVIEKAGPTELGDRAAAKALRCLRLIHTGRFGREAEIKAAEQGLVKWRWDYARHRATQRPAS